MPRKGTTLLAFLGGALAGAGLALLFAPRPGAETRKRVGRWLKEKADEGRALAERGADKGAELLDEAREAVAGKKAARGAAEDRA